MTFLQFATSESSSARHVMTISKRVSLTERQFVEVLRYCWFARAVRIGFCFLFGTGVHRLFTAEYEKKLEVAMGNRDESSKRDMIAMSPPSELVTISVYCAKALAEKRLASYPNRTAAATFCFDYTLEENQRSFFDTQSKEDAETFGMLHKLGFVIIRHPKPHELMNWAEVQQVIALCVQDPLHYCIIEALAIILYHCLLAGAIPVSIWRHR